MFRRISYIIALQFTGFVFLLFLINGALFLIADFDNARRTGQDVLMRNAHLIQRGADDALHGMPFPLPPHMRERVRVIDGSGFTIYDGGLFTNTPIPRQEGFSSLILEGEEFNVFTALIPSDKGPIGYLQVADSPRQRFSDMPRRIAIYLFVSGVISILTFIVGLFFARRSLKPAEESMLRLEQFTQDASHELRTPLAALSSSLDLALKTENYRAGITSAKEDVRLVAQLVDRLLELARLDRSAIKFEKINLSDLIELVVEKQKISSNDKHVIIDMNVAKNVHVKGDELLVRQVVTNLIQNAVKFTPSHGKVTIYLTKDKLTVEDTGIGIAHDELPHIFDRFYRADSSRSKDGFGLGLSLVKRIIDLHRWSITAKSKKGHGTAFTVTFKD